MSTRRSSPFLRADHVRVQSPGTFSRRELVTHGREALSDVRRDRFSRATTGL